MGSASPRARSRRARAAWRADRMPATFHAIPIFRIFDVAKAKEFYIDFLGFRVDWEHRFEEGLPLHMQISKDGYIVHLSEHHGDCSPAPAIRIETDELQMFQNHLLHKNSKHSHPPTPNTP